MWTQALSIVAFGSLLVESTPLDRRQTVQGVENALGLGKDPSAFSQVQSGTRQYYFPGVYSPSKDLFIQTSSDLNTVLSVPANNHSIFTTQDTPNDVGFFQYGTNNYIISYTQDPPNDGPSYLRVLQNKGSDLTKGWADIGIIKNTSGSTLTHVYDSQAFQHPNGNKYILYSHNANTIMIAQFVNETTVKNAVKVVSSGSTTEAPGLLVQGSTLNIFWSENGYYTPKYNVLGLSVSTSADPTSAATWANRPVTTILASSSTNGVYGPGSASTFTGPDGKPWITYSCFYNSSGLSGSRRVQAQPVQFSGETIATLTPVKPSRFVTSTTS